MMIQMRRIRGGGGSKRKMMQTRKDKEDRGKDKRHVWLLLPSYLYPTPSRSEIKTATDMPLNLSQLSSLLIDWYLVCSWTCSSRSCGIAPPPMMKSFMRRMTPVLLQSEKRSSKKRKRRFGSFRRRQKWTRFQRERSTSRTRAHHTKSSRWIKTESTWKRAGK